MTDEFILSVQHNGTEHELKANMIPWGYTHKFRVIVNETDIFFEPDEEGSYRAVIMPGQDEKILQKISRSFMQAIQESIESILAYKNKLYKIKVLLELFLIALIGFYC